MRTRTSSSSGNNFAPWRSIAYCFLVVAILGSAVFNAGFTPKVAAASPALSSPQAQTVTQTPETDKEKEQKEKDAQEQQTAAPAPNSANPPTRGVLSGNAVTFVSTDAIDIRDNTSASPYPSTLNVSGFSGTLNGLTVSLYGLTHTYPDDIDILLVGPGGQKTILMSDRGGGIAIKDINLTFDDNAALSITTTQIVSGTYKPSDNGTGTSTDNFLGPAPAQPYSVTLSVFDNINPNGNWQLYVMDDANIDTGYIIGGWALTFYSNQATIAATRGNGQATTVGTTFASPLQATVKDAASVLVPGALVTFTVVSTNGASATFAGGSSTYIGTTDAQGVVTTTALTANTVAGNFMVKATTASAASPTYFVLRNASATVATLAIVSGSGQSAVVSTAFAQPLVAQALDQFNNPVPRTVITYTAPATGPSGRFANNSTVYSSTSNISGVLTSTTFTANAITGTYVVTASSPGVSSPAAFNLTNLPPDVVQFNSSQYTTTEGAGSAVVTLTRTGSGLGVVVASLKITDVTTNAADYVLSSLALNSGLDTSFNPGTGTGANETYKAIVLPTGQILLAGAFTAYNGQAVGRVARLNSDGSLDTTFQSTGAGTNNTVHSMATQSDGKIIIVGGGFTTYNGITRTRIARLNADGSLDTTFDPSTGANAAIYRVAVQTDGKILIGGDFTTFNGITRTRIARLNSDGSVDTSFAASGTGASATVWSLLVQPDGKILIGGDFAFYNGTSARGLARLNSDGTLDTSFTSIVAGANGIIWDIALQPDNKIIIAGDLTSFNGSRVGYIARLNSTDGSVDSSFLGGGVGANATIRSLAYQSDGKLLFGGNFTTFNAIPTTRIGRLNTDGTFDYSILSGGSGPNNLIWTVAPQADKKFIVGGDFTTYDGVSRNHIARAGGYYSVYWLNGDTTPKTFSLPLVDDLLLEGTEQLIIGVSVLTTTASLGTPVTATVNILDNDPYSIQASSGSGQSTLTNSAFAQPLVALVKDSSSNPQAGVLVTFTAPASGASGTFANDTTVYTGTTNASGLVTTSLFTANAISGTYVVTATGAGISNSAGFTLTNIGCNPLVVTAITDNGQATTCGTLSYALITASSGTTITFALIQGNTITFTSNLTPTISAGVTIDGGANGIVLNGKGEGLRLEGNNTLINLTVRRFAGRELVTLGTGNKLIRVRLES